MCMIPKTARSLERDYSACLKKKKFVLIDKTSYKDYFIESHPDLASAKKELEAGDLKWSFVKIYQSLFLLCNSILVKNLGFYSKDHKCLITALMKNKLIPENVLKSVKEIIKKKTLFEEINDVRIGRNKAMYFPKTQRKLTDNEIREAFGEVEKLIDVLGDAL